MLILSPLQKPLHRITVLRGSLKHNAPSGACGRHLTVATLQLARRAPHNIARYCVRAGVARHDTRPRDRIFINA